MIWRKLKAPAFAKRDAKDKKEGYYSFIGSYLSTYPF